MSSSLESELFKLPIKSLEIPIGKFNDVAIPHHIDLLKKHKSNILEYHRNQDWQKVYTEQINASRVVKQLKQLLYDMDALKAKVCESDISKFDKKILKARTDTISAIKEYLDLKLEIPVDKTGTISEKTSPNSKDPYDERFLQLQAEDKDLERLQVCSNAWIALQEDLQELQQLYVDFNKIVHTQVEPVNTIELLVEDAQVNVDSGERLLRKSAKYKAMTYPLVGAIAGSCIGGPIGFIAGLKIGGLTAVCGALLGFTSGKVLTKVNQPLLELKQIEAPLDKATSNTVQKEKSKLETKKDL